MSDSDKFYTVRGYEILKKHKKLLTYSMEDYLEMIYRKSLSEGYTRINALSKSLNVRPSSATKMVQKLAKLGFVRYRKYDVILLTEKGKDMGKFLLDRHNIIEKFFNILGLKENILVNIELMEHNITNNALEEINMLNCFFQENPSVQRLFKEYKNYNKTC